MTRMAEWADSFEAEAQEYYESQAFARMVRGGVNPADAAVAAAMEWYVPAQDE